MGNTHFANLIYNQSLKFENKTALYYKQNNGTQWEEISWVAFAERIKHTGKALIELGVVE